MTGVSYTYIIKDNLTAPECDDDLSSENPDFVRIYGIYTGNVQLGKGRIDCYCYVTNMYNILIFKNRCVIFIMRHG